MRSLVVSDLHLGSVMHRDVLRRPAALDALLQRLEGIDRLVLLGDVVEMLEGRPSRALRDAEPVLRAMGDAMGRGRQVLVVPGNHDARLVVPFLRGLRAEGKPLRPSTRVPVKSSPELAALTGWLKPAKVEVRYPGAFLAPGVWAHHGHYVDRELLPPAPGPLRARTTLPERAHPEDYERAVGNNMAAAQAALQAELPTLPAAALELAAGALREAALRASPMLGSTLRDRLAPLGAGFLGWQFRTRGLPAMAAVTKRLQVRADHVIFGHLHLGGPRERDDSPWRPVQDGPALLNTGCWVHEPLLLGGVEPPHGYWPGGAVLVPGDGEPPEFLRLLDHVGTVELGLRDAA